MSIPDFEQGNANCFSGVGCLSMGRLSIYQRVLLVVRKSPEAIGELGVRRRYYGKFSSIIDIVYETCIGMSLF